MTDPDIFTCPRCKGPADNGFSRGLPPEPYVCTKCEESGSIYDFGGDEMIQNIENALRTLTNAVAEKHPLGADFGRFKPEIDVLIDFCQRIFDGVQAGELAVVPVVATHDMGTTGACYIAPTDYTNDRYYSAKAVYAAMIKAAPSIEQLLGEDK